MVSFLEAESAVLYNGNKTRLMNFLKNPNPTDVKKNFLEEPFKGRHGLPSFNGIVPSVPVLNSVLTVDVLTKASKESLNHILRYAVRDVCFEGNKKDGFPLLDRLVAAGARHDYIQEEQDCYFRLRHVFPKNNESNLKYLDKKVSGLMNATNNNPTRLDEVLETSKDVREYVDRLVAQDASIYGRSISRLGRPVPRTQYQELLTTAAEYHGFSLTTALSEKDAFKRDVRAITKARSLPKLGL